MRSSSVKKHFGWGLIFLSLVGLMGAQSCFLHNMRMGTEQARQNRAGLQGVGEYDMQWEAVRLGSATQEEAHTRIF